MTSTFYPPYHLGGDAVHVKYLAEELTKRGHEVHVLHSLDAYKVKRRSLPEKSELCGVNTHVIRTHFNLSPYTVYALGNSSSITRKFESLVREIKPDVVHHHNISLLGYGLFEKRNHYHNLYTVLDCWLICQQNNLLKNGSEICEGPSCFFCALRCRRLPQLWRLGNGLRKAIGNIDMLISPSNYMLNRISQSWKVKAVTIPNFAPEPPDPIEPSGFSDFFLYAGVLEKHKGILGLINTYKQICGEIDEKLLVVGDGNLKDKVEGFIRRNKLESEIVLLGWIDHSLLYRLLKDASALITPSIWPENSPLIALEALSVGTPVIASDNGGLPEIVKDIDGGLIFDSTDRLKRILLNFDKDKCSRSAIRALHRNRYSSEAYLKRYFKLFVT